MGDQDKKKAVCPNCGKPVRRAVTSREFGGQVSKCPWCKAQFTLDGLEGAQKAPQGEGE